MVSTEYKNKLSKQINSIPNNAQRASDVYVRLAPLLNKYKGGMPAGFLAAIASFESGGKMSSRGDSTLGEVGIFQITKSFPPKVGLASNTRFEEENNVFLGCLEYQIMAIQMWLAHPQIPLGSSDSWKLARLAFAIGSGGTRKLLQASQARSYKELAAYVDKVGGVSLGRQSASKVWFRVHVIDVLWQIGQLVNPSFWIGAPVKIPKPPAGPYIIPDSVVKYLPSPWRGPLIGLGIGTAALLLA